MQCVLPVAGYTILTCRASHDTPFLCNNTQFPDHRHQSRAQLCGAPLSKVVHTRNGRNEVKLVQTLCYNPISDQLARILQRFNTEVADLTHVAFSTGKAHYTFHITDCLTYYYV